jgi:alcohol dehydrogenase class IV
VYDEYGLLDYFLPTRVIMGWGRAAEAASLTRSFGKRALLVTMRDIPHGERVAAQLRANGLAVLVYEGCEPEPSAEGIDRAWEALRSESCDCIVAVGGGSAIDTAKALNALQAGGGRAWEYTLEMGEHKRPVQRQGLLPLIAMPTTAGTGAEVTFNAVLTNQALQKKAPIRDAALYPSVALVDPELTLSMPAGVTASTGFDAFTHAYERFFGTERLSPLAHHYCVDSMRLVAEHLEGVLVQPGKRRGREAMSWAATEAGLALAVAGGEAALHVFGLPIGAVAHASHGRALAIMTAAITRRQVSMYPQRGQELGTLLGMLASELVADEGLAERIATRLVDWLQRLGLPTRLRDVGVGPQEVELLVRAISLPRARQVFGPSFDVQDVRQMYVESL